MWILVSDSIVRHVQPMPPELNDSLIMPTWAFWPGKPLRAGHCGNWTSESRGKLINVAPSRFGEMWARMIVSVRSPAKLPYFAFAPFARRSPRSARSSPG